MLFAQAEYWVPDDKLAVGVMVMVFATESQPILTDPKTVPPLQLEPLVIKILVPLALVQSSAVAEVKLTVCGPSSFTPVVVFGVQTGEDGAPKAVPE